VDIAKMRQVLAVRQYGSFAKAAEALGIAQPSLSKSIARLEDELGVRIFDRAATGSELTPIGEVIAERAARVVSEAEDIVRDAALIAGGEAGLIRVGIGGSLSGEYLSRLTAGIAHEHPQLKLHIVVDQWAALVDALAAREVDIIICALGLRTDDPRFVVTDVMHCAGVASASPGHPLAGQALVTAADLAAYKCAGTTGAFRNAAVLGQPDSENLSAYTSNSYAALLPLTLSGEAVLLAPILVVRQAIEDGALVRLNLDLQFGVSFVAITTRAAHYSPILNRLIRRARAIGQALQAECEAAELVGPTSALSPP
jgi:DNA-binding transcriptional LysR family regulator